jgi:hypothetical protein
MPMTREQLVADAIRETYLGDGLYCRFDGYQFILRAPREDGDHHVGLEPYVLLRFDEERERIDGIRKLVAEIDTGESH